MFSIAGENFVLRAKSANAAHAHGLLTDIEVHEAANIASCVFFSTFLLESA